MSCKPTSLARVLVILPGEWVSGGEWVLCGYVSGDGECGKYCTVEEKCKIVKQ